MHAQDQYLHVELTVRPYTRAERDKIALFLDESTRRKSGTISHLWRAIFPGTVESGPFSSHDNAGAACGKRYSAIIISRSGCRSATYFWSTQQSLAH